MKKIKSFLTVFLVALLLVNATSFNLVNANDGDTSDVSQEGQNVEIKIISKSKKSIFPPNFVNSLKLIMRTA